MTVALSAADIGSFVRVGELPIGAVFAPALDLEVRVVAQYPDGTMGHFGENRAMVLVPTRLVRLVSFPPYSPIRGPGCSVHGTAHDDTDERDCGAGPQPSAKAEALKAMVLQYGVHSIEFGATGTAWGSLSSRVRTGLAGEIDDAIDTVFRERDEWERRAESLLHDVEEYTRLRDAQTGDK